MSKEDIYKKKKKSNWIIMSKILGSAALIFVLAIIKMEAWA